MNFFQSVFSDDPDPPNPTPQPEPKPEPENPQTTPTPTIPSITSAWTFGSTLIQTLTTKSDSLIQTYRQDLHEFTSGIKKETAVIRQAAVNAVKDLPTSLESTADLAQSSLESVGQAIDDLGTTVTEIIAHGKESIMTIDYNDTDSGSDNNNNIDSVGVSKAYSRFDAQVRAIQSDMNTYLNDPEDGAEFSEWKNGFGVDGMSGEVEGVMRENDGVVGEIYREIVPGRVDEGTFWWRYFYKVEKVRRAEEARVRVVKRAMGLGEEDEEELSWDVDEDEYVENAEAELRGVERKGLEEKEFEKMSLTGAKNEEGNELEADNLEVKTASEGKTDKDSDFSVVSSQASPEEESWDEIEDIGSSDENKDKVVSHGSRGSADRAELHKRLSVAEEEEDLTWDIEDDDETVNA